MKAICALVLAVCLALAGLNTAEAVDGDPVGTWPLSPTPEVVHDFDPPDDPWGSGHRGVDLAGSIGQSVRSALPGTVSFVGRIAGKPVVTVSHGETRTTYEPVSSDLGVGAVVAAGDRIGSLTLPFSHCFPGACLHWGWRRGETYLDPLDLVGDRRVRLLPLWRDDPVDHDAGTSWPAPSPLSPPSPLSLPALLAAVPLPYAAWSPALAGLVPRSRLGR